VLEAIQTPGPHLIVGDFNLHHTEWGGDTVSQNHARATPIINRLSTNQLDLLIELGTTTREKYRNTPSTLTLAFSTQNLTPWVVSYKVDTHLESDHKHIVTTIQTDSQTRTRAALKRNFKKADTYAIAVGRSKVALCACTRVSNCSGH
jgi:hypothetical protein